MSEIDNMSVSAPVPASAPAGSVAVTSGQRSSTAIVQHNAASSLSAVEAAAPPLNESSFARSTDESSAVTPASSSALSSNGNVKAATKRITADAKKELHDYFTQLNWPLNKDLPRGTPSADLKYIMDKHSLTKKQVSLQLKNFKKEKYGLSQVKLVLHPGELDERIRQGLGTDSRAFVIETIDKMLKMSSPSSDFNNFSKVLDDIEGSPRSFLEALVQQPDAHCVQLLVDLIDHWISYAAETFPKSAACVSGAELEFQKKKRERKCVFVKEWKLAYRRADGVSEEAMSDIVFAHFGLFLHNTLFMNWSYSAVESGKPIVSIPEQNLVGKYAKVVIYYVAGWTLHSMSKAKTIARGERQKFFDFVRNNRMESNEADAAGLPTTLVKRRKRMAKMYATNEYFEFICFVESTFLANLTLEMMMAYAEGNLIHEIKMRMLDDEIAEKFTNLCILDDDVDGDDRRKIMKYILTRYSNMRGFYFVKHLHGTGGAGIDQFVNSQATRTKVANAVARSKAVGDAAMNDDHAVAEEKIWTAAGESVLENHDKEYKQLN